MNCLIICLICVDLSYILVFSVIFFFYDCFLGSYIVIILFLIDVVVNIFLICGVVNSIVVGIVVIICLVFIVFVDFLCCYVVIIIFLIYFVVNILVCSIVKF